MPNQVDGRCFVLCYPLNVHVHSQPENRVALLVVPPAFALEVQSLAEAQNREAWRLVLVETLVEGGRWNQAA